jgi:hypothetical protein
MHPQRQRKSSSTNISISLNAPAPDNQERASLLQVNAQTRTLSQQQREMQFKPRQEIRTRKEYLDPYDAKFCIAVVGCDDSGKEEIIGKECDYPVKQIEDIRIVNKIYQWSEKTIQVEYWCAPESQHTLSYTARLVAGLAGSIFFFDGRLN